MKNGLLTRDTSNAIFTARRTRIKSVEAGGPSVRQPAKTGYGSQLIRYATTYSLGGKVEQNYAPSGLETEIVVPLSKP